MKLFPVSIRSHHGLWYSLWSGTSEGFSEKLYKNRIIKQIGLNGKLKNHLVQPHRNKQKHLHLDQLSQSSGQSDLECFQDRASLSMSVSVSVSASASASVCLCLCLWLCPLWTISSRVSSPSLWKKISLYLGWIHALLV